MTPVRVQLSRQKGWKMPPNTVKCDRSTKHFGNPYRIGQTFNDLKNGVRDAAHAVELYRAVTGPPNHHRPPGIEKLRGKNLACWCPLDQPCHVDVLLEIANE